jgi:hypothetical protein
MQIRIRQNDADPTASGYTTLIKRPRKFLFHKEESRVDFETACFSKQLTNGTASYTSPTEFAQHRAACSYQ